MSDERFNPDYKAKIDEIMLVIPGVKSSKAFGYPAYKINGKVFAFFGGTAVSLKLPAARVADLITSNPDVMSAFEPASGIVWKEWLNIQRNDPLEYEQDIALFEESVEYVLS